MKSVRYLPILFNLATTAAGTADLRGTPDVVSGAELVVRRRAGHC